MSSNQSYKTNLFVNKKHKQHRNIGIRFIFALHKKLKSIIKSTFQYLGKKIDSIFSYNGVVWNDSLFPIEYIVYGKFDQVVDSTTESTIKPMTSLNNKIKISSFELKNKTGINPKYQKSFVRVQPNRSSTSGLSNLQMDQHKITLRVVLDEFQYILLNDIVIKAQTDMCLKVRGDLSVKNMSSSEASEVILKNSSKSGIESMDTFLDKMTKREEVKQKMFDMLRKTQSLRQSVESRIFDKLPNQSQIRQ